MPSYTLAPDARVAQITRQAAAATEFAASLVEGPVRIAGHSAGGHLASRLLCTDIPLSPQLAGRIAHVVSISGISDVRPMLRLALNETFGFDEAEAAAESKGGVGLGLALVRQIAEKHRGEVRCLAREGGGSCFELRLPAVSA
jgi:acetyl esterase/lipase